MESIKSYKNWFLEALQKKEIFLHLIFWVAYLLFPYVKSITSGYPYNFFNELNNLVFGMVIFYLTYFVILPSKNKLYSSILLFILFVAVAYANLKTHNALFGGSHKEPFLYYGLGYFSTYTMLFLFAYVLYAVKKGYQQQQLIEKAKIEKQQAELSSLKAQINPHFLFNTLNMIYSSSLKKEDKAPDLILKLSDNFRYLLKSGTKNIVSIKEDIVHIKDYVSLQKERLNNKIFVDFSVAIDDENQKITPLLFLPFIENAFKYGSLINKPKHPIYIAIELKKGLLTFDCRNPYDSNSKSYMDATWQKSGIGIENTRKRLDYFYKDNYKLVITDKAGNFKVNLQVQL